MVETSVERNLSVLEELYFLADRICASQFVLMARVEKPIEEEALRLALDRVQIIHWQLRARIRVSTSGALFFNFENVPEIPLVVIQERQEHIVEQIESELNDKIVPWSGPLARCVMVRHPEGSQSIILVLSHYIADGLSAVILLRYIIDFSRTGLEVLKFDAYGGPLEQRVPHTYTVLHTLGGAVRRVINRLHGPKTLQPLAHSNNPRVRLVTSELDAYTTSLLATRSREEGVSVHAALCAAQALALDRVLCRGAEAKCSLSHAVDLRRKIGASREFGIFSVTVVTNHVVSAAGSDFWSLAREIGDKLSGSLRRGDAFGALRLAKFLVIFGRAIGISRRMEKLGPRIMRLLGRRHFPISNLGLIGSMHGESEFEVEEIDGALTGPGWAIAPLAGTFGGRLRWNFMYVWPDISSKQATEVADQAVFELKNGLD